MSETKNVTKPILEALTKAGYFAMRLNSGRIKSRSGGWIMLCPEGTADLVIYPHKCLPVWIETKDPKGRTAKDQLEAQARFRETVQSLGHSYVRATCLDDVLTIIRGVTP